MNKQILFYYTAFLLAIAIQITSGKLRWKVKPQVTQIAKENEQVKLNCEFEDDAYDASVNNSTSLLAKYFVIWYKDGASQNVLSLNDQLANLNAASTYEIVGKYNLLIRNLTRQHSGVYTCQLFQSNDLVASTNLTVLVAPKYAKLSLLYADDVNKLKSDDDDYLDPTISSSATTTKRSLSLNKTSLMNKRGYFVENDQVYLECCTNADVNPKVQFKWKRHSKANVNEQVDLSALQSPRIKFIKIDYDEKTCSLMPLNLTRKDNSYSYRCLVSNDAFVDRKPISDNLSLVVEYKPEVNLHLGGLPSVNQKLTVIENSSVTLFCNTSAQPAVTTYEWYLNDERLLESRTNTLLLHNVQKQNNGVYSCKCFNRHGDAKASFKIEIIYVSITPTNRTVMQQHQSQNQFNFLKNSKSIYLNAYEHKPITLQCDIKSIPKLSQVNWYFHQLNQNNEMIRKVSLNNLIRNPNVISMNTVDDATSMLKNYFTQITLNNLTYEQIGYYTCEITYFLNDSLNQTLKGVQNSTYFLQVQYAPIIRPIKRVVYSNNYDQVELSCEIKSNPQSMFSWLFGPSKELYSSYKYNLSSLVYKQINRNILDEFENMHHYRSNLIINSVTQFDYGEYYCKAHNLIGESSFKIILKKKHKPETPIDFKIIETKSNSVILSWVSGLNGGENSTYLVNINNDFNLTTFTENVNNDMIDEQNKYNTIEIKGLKSMQTYEFKVLAYNSMGSSEFTRPVKAQTLKTTLRPERLPNIQNAQFNEIREAICFDLESSSISHTESLIFNQQLKEIVIKLEIDSNEEMIHEKLNNIYSLLYKNHSLSPPTKKQMKAIVEPLQKTKTIFINLNKLKFGQNCILYSQLFEFDQKNAKNIETFGSNQRHIYYLTNTDNQITKSLSTIKTNNTKSSSNFKMHEFNGNSFFEFKKLNKINLTICYTNDTSVCAEKLAVYDYNSDFSAYVTLIAIGCSAILIFLVLLISSVCCCCCCRRQKNNKASQLKNKGKKSTSGDINSKLVIKSFPISVTAQQSNFEYSSDGSTKSSQQHILNAYQNSTSHSSGSSSSAASDSITLSGVDGHTNVINGRLAVNSVNYYKTNSANHDIIEHQNIYDSHIIIPRTSNSSNNNYVSHAYIQNSSSVATVESDISSSGSLENQQTKASPNETINEQLNHNGYFSPIASSSSSYTNALISSSQKQSLHSKQQAPLAAPPTTIIYNTSNNMLIKSFQHQQQQSKLNSNQDSPESGYSTPISKRLVYEVIV